MSCPIYDCLGLFDVDTKELEALNPLLYSPVNENWGVLGPPFPVVNNHLCCLDHIEGEVAVLAPHGQVSDLLPIGCLIIVGDQATVGVGVGVLLGLAVMGEQEVQEGAKHAPRGAPVLRISVADVLLPTLTTSGSPGSSCRGKC